MAELFQVDHCYIVLIYSDGVFYEIFQDFRHMFHTETHPNRPFRQSTMPFPREKYFLRVTTQHVRDTFPEIPIFVSLVKGYVSFFYSQFYKDWSNWKLLVRSHRRPRRFHRAFLEISATQWRLRGDREAWHLEHRADAAAAAGCSVPGAREEQLQGGAP